MTPVDQPALEDDDTARLFELAVQRVRGGSYGPLLVLGATGLGVWQFAYTPEIAVLIACAGLGALWGLITRSVWGASGWPVAARVLLEEQPWRETPATVLDTRGTVLALPGDWHVRVHDLSAPAREVVVRTGRVWIVGPDNAGWLAVRVDGLHTPLPAKRVAAGKAAPARPTTEPIVTAWGRHLVGRARSDLWFALGGAAGFTVLAGVWWIVVGAAVGGAGLVAYAARELRRAVRLRDAGPWQRAEASVPSWTGRQNGTGEGTIALRFPDGHRYTAHLDGVPLDVFANAWREEALWVAPGGVVGFPDYPVVAFARLTPET